MKSETPRYLVLTAIATLLACSDGQASPGAAGDGGGGAGGDGGNVAADGGAEGDGGTIVPSSGCGAAGATGLQEKTITVSGVARSYKLFVPAALDASKPTRLVFVFHGLGGNAAQIRAYLGLEAEAGADALLVYPEGVVRLQGRTGWSEEDLPFFDAMVTEIAGARCVDQKRIFATGHSFGGYMTNLVGCLRGDVVRAIAPVSGGLVASGACKGPVAAWLAHGDQDPTVPQSEGIAARDRWIKANGCAATSKPTAPGQCVAYDGCSRPVTWCSFPGGHYPLPAYTKQAVWDFFKAM
jgi:poly(3-hydroxybutyrate) depolymerase